MIDFAVRKEKTMFSVGVHNFKRAKTFAERVHFGQMYGLFPYTKHLDDVDNVLVRFGFFHNWDLRIAGQLHDAVEDTTEDSKINIINTILLDFGVDVWSIVESVTDGKGKNRKERKAAVYEKLKNNKKGKIVKLADRIANVEWSLLTNLSLLKMYLKEQESFTDNLFDRDDGEELYIMWKHLDYLISLGNFSTDISLTMDNPSIMRRN